MSNAAPITLEQLFRYWKNLPHQAGAVQLLEQDLAVNGYAVAMRRDRAWFQTWSQDGKQADLAGPRWWPKDFALRSLLKLRHESTDRGTAPSLT